jgi:hypothetical protein
VSEPTSKQQRAPADAATLSPQAAGNSLTNLFVKAQARGKLPTDYMQFIFNAFAMSAHNGRKN